MRKAFAYKLPVNKEKYVYVALYRDISEEDDLEKIRDELLEDLSKRNKIKKSLIEPVDDEEWKRVNS